MIKNKLIYSFSLCLLLLFFVMPVEAREDLKGKILLQVESHGEAWYVLPDTQERVFLGRPYQAFMIMRDYGLGITSVDLNKYLQAGFPARLSGKIMLAVEANGEAYYINPDNLQGYYLGRPDDAFSIMKGLGLGISNNDLLNIVIKEGISVPETIADPVLSDSDNNDLAEEVTPDDNLEFTPEDDELIADDLSEPDQDNLLETDNDYVQAVELTEAITLLPYDSNLEDFLSEVKDVYQLVKYLNNYFNFVNDSRLVSQDYESFYDSREGSMVDFVSFVNFVLKSKNYQSGVLRYGDNLAIVFRDQYSPKYIVFSENGGLIFEHGRSFRDVVINEEKRLNISVDKYLYFEGSVLDYRQEIEPYTWVNL
ncbi:MAG: hypothetical protein K9M44_04030 [Candidatus Pacebacteria bacterium]|nr:hypothetical protein [Candidatus Paceibacterota bacterium]